MTLVLYRIDDRLIHGQVVVGWGQPLNVRFIVLVDATVAGSEWEQDLYRMGVPPEMQVYFHGAEAAVTAIPGYRADPRAGILLTGDIATMMTLVKGANIEAVNVGGIHSRPGRIQRMRYVFLTPEEEHQLREVEALGATVTAQDVPGARPVSLDHLIGGVQP